MNEDAEKELLQVFLFHAGKVLTAILLYLVKPEAEQLYIVFGKERPGRVLLNGLGNDAEGEGIDGGVHTSIAFGIKMVFVVIDEHQHGKALALVGFFLVFAVAAAMKGMSKVD